MATLNCYETIRKIIARNGDDNPPPGEPPEPPVIRIVEYTNAWGGKCWGVVWKGEPNPYRYDEASAYVQNPQVIFERRATP